MTSDLEREPAGLRARAERCRAFAREYATDVGASLSELAVELDLKADRLDAQERDKAGAADPPEEPAPT
jgi:hypothetical protein